MNGVCKYCGQVVIDTVDEENASENCTCGEAELHRKLKAAAQGAKEIVKDLFGEGCVKRGLIALNSDVITALFSLVDLMGEGSVTGIKVDLPGICSIKMKITGSSIKVERIEGRKYQSVAGVQ